MIKFNESVHYLGKLCLYDHNFNKTGKSIRSKRSKMCAECVSIRGKKERKKKSGYIDVRCFNCDKELKKAPWEIKRYPTHFCCFKCCGQYHAKNKNRPRTSRIENWIQKTLREKYLNLTFSFNNRSELDGLELDIFIPSLRLAFELNGRVHYEPIFGEESFINVQSRDKRKFQLCIENTIELCIIDISSIRSFRESSPNKAMWVLDEISKIIDFSIKRNIVFAPCSAQGFPV